MRLHRLVLTNYRGIAHREVEFPDRGVVVVSGANEIGKSSMIEALDLLFDAKDRSTKKEVKQVKPTHADVGAEITAEISTGAYRFVYHKRFHKRAETRLTVLSPAREQLTGDEAHERVLALLAETVDMCLWQAQRVLQTSATAPVDLSGSDALSRALDVAAGEAETLSGAEPLLVDRVETEYARYFTPTGRPTGEWGAATKRLQAAEAEVARRAAAVAEVDDAVSRHTALTADLADLRARRVAVEDGLTQAQAAADAVAALRRQLKEAQIVADAAAATHTAALGALTERRRLRADIDERGAAITALQAAVAQADEQEGTARDVQEAAEQEAEQARAVVEAGQARVTAARAVVDSLAAREEADRLAVRLAKIDAGGRELDRIGAELAAIVVTDVSMRSVEQAAVAVERAAGQAEMASARIELVAANDVAVRVTGEPVSLRAGDVWSTATTVATDIELPDLLTVRVVPGTPAAQMQATLDDARAQLAAALRAAGVADVAAARDADVRRRELLGRRDTVRATVDALTGDDRVDELRARLAELTDAQPAATGLFDLAAIDLPSARRNYDAATTEHQHAVSACETHRKVAVAAGKRLADRTTEACVMREKLAAARSELASATGRLEAARAAVDDDALAVRAQAAADDMRRSAERVEALGVELTRAQPDVVAVALEEARRTADTLGARHDEAVEALREVAAQLKVYGTEGRQGHLDAAETECEHARAEHRRVQRRARAAETLRSVMTRHRDQTRSRYVEPYRAEVERLGRLVFGADFEVEVDSTLSICSRTVAGRTVPYESLSGGAKEQLGIVARLAGASLVADADTVPVVIDDALGFTDAQRLTKMGAVFDAVGGDGQVIVLTCSPQRYAAVGNAHHIELSVAAETSAGE
jgi:hypothetical protein